MRKICDNCGQDLPSSATVCNLCGEAMQSSASSVQSQPAQISATPQQSQSKKTSMPSRQSKSTTPSTPHQIQQQYTYPAQQPAYQQQSLSRNNIVNQIKAFARKKPILLVSIGATLLVVCVLIGVLASGGGRSALVGKWNYDMNVSEGPPLLLSDSIEFASNGTLRYSQGYGFQDAGTWSVSNGKLFFDAGGGYKGSLEYKVRGNMLTLIGDYELVYTKGR